MYAYMLKAIKVMESTVWPTLLVLPYEGQGNIYRKASAGEDMCDSIFDDRVLEGLRTCARCMSIRK